MGWKEKVIKWKQKERGRKKKQCKVGEKGEEGEGKREIGGRKMEGRPFPVPLTFFPFFKSPLIPTLFHNLTSLESHHTKKSVSDKKKMSVRD